MRTVTIALEAGEKLFNADEVISRLERIQCDYGPFFRHPIEPAVRTDSNWGRYTEWWSERQLAQYVADETERTEELKHLWRGEQMLHDIRKFLRDGRLPEV